MTEVSPENVLMVISKAEYEQLKADSNFLQNLRDAGVNNWQGYHYGYGGDPDE